MIIKCMGWYKNIIINNNNNNTCLFSHLEIHRTPAIVKNSKRISTFKRFK